MVTIVTLHERYTRTFYPFILVLVMIDTILINNLSTQTTTVNKDKKKNQHVILCAHTNM